MPMTTDTSDFERSLHEYAEYSDRVNARIDTLLPGYGIIETDVEVDPQAAVSEQIIRLTIAHLVEHNNSEELTAEDLYVTKRDALVKLLEEDRFEVDSAWIDLINDLAVPDSPVVFDSDMFAAIEENRKKHLHTRALVREDIEQWLDSLTPEERRELLEE